MSEESTLGTGEAGDEGAESDVIKGFRAREKAKDAEIADLRARPSAADIETSVRASVARESVISQALVTANVPVSVAKLVQEKLGDAEVTPEGIATALVDLGFGSTEPALVEEAADGLTEVVSLGASVQAVAGVTEVADLDAKIAAAKTGEEVQAIMAEAAKAGL